MNAHFKTYRLLDVFLSRYAPTFSTILLGPAPPALPLVAQRCLLVLIGLHRACYMAPAVVAGAASPHRSTALDLALLVAAVGWTAAFLIRSARTGRLRTGVVSADVLVTGSLLLTASGEPADSPSAVWLTGVAQSCALLLGAVARYASALVMMAFLPG